MEDYKKYLIIFGLLFLFILISPIILALLNIILSPFITTVGVVVVIFIATIIIAWFGKIGRK